MTRRPSEPAGLWERFDPDVSLCGDQQDRIDQAIVWPIAANFDEISDNEVHQPLRLVAGNRRQDDQARVEIDAPRQLAEVVGILGHQNPILRNGSGKHDMIGFAQPRPIARMDRIVQSVSV